jgi:hypothetical protein
LGGQQYQVQAVMLFLASVVKLTAGFSHQERLQILQESVPAFPALNRSENSIFRVNLPGRKQ